MPTPVIIDCDPGHDDAMALLLAVASPELEVVAVTTVAGNQTLDKVTANAIRVLDVAEAHDIPVAAGADRALIHPARVASEVHGETGLDGPDLPPPSRAPEPLHAVELLARKLRERPLTLIPIGPLTNIALLLATHPELAQRIERIVVMGGAIGLGNVTPSAEFNIWADPEAAARVFGSGLERHDGRPRRHPPRDAVEGARRGAARRAAAPAPSSPTCTPSTASSTSGSMATATRRSTTRSPSPT